MKNLTIFLITLTLLIAGFIPADESIGVKNTLEYYKTQSRVFGEKTTALKELINQSNPNDSVAVEKIKTSLADCRLAYKRIEFFLEHFIPLTARPFNLAPVYEVEEPFIEFQHPRGMQLMEAVLFSDEVADDYKVLKDNAELISIYANDLYAALYDLKVRDEEVVESIRMELLRIITLGITGFDAPEMKTGIDEAHEALLSLQQILKPYVTSVSGDRAKSLIVYLNRCIELTSKDPDFNAFNRMNFLTEAALPLQHQLNLLAKELFPAYEFQTSFNLDASSVFSKNALLVFKYDTIQQKEMRELGKKLFFDKRLSGNGQRSCATCHNPSLYFTDGLTKSMAFNGKETVQRNSPTLLYATMQHGLFWDARSRSAQDQVTEVLLSKTEMNGSHAIIAKNINADKSYRTLFSKLFPASKKDTIISIKNIATAIAAFEQSLAPMNSPFDQYMAGDKTTLSKKQINGFNLFNGKAQCGTCHFAPVFNGLLPPYYSLTELEVLGTTSGTDFNNPKIDADSGRYRFFPVEYNNGAFKTPTIRNISKTAPYMHNGAFETLEQVMDFYNKGGGEGLGVRVEHQTLSSGKLDLSQEEISDIISFMESLTDKLPDDLIRH